MEHICKRCGHHELLCICSHPMDSTGRPIKTGDFVKFRGKVYTIKEFVWNEGRYGTARVVFNEPQHINEPADEVSIDLVDRPDYV